MKNLTLSPIAPEILIERISEKIIANITNLAVRQPQTPAEKLLTIQEAAEFLNLSVPTLYSKVSRNEIPFMKKGKRLYFSDKELMAYVKNGKRKSQDELEAEAADYLKQKGGDNA